MFNLLYSVGSHLEVLSALKVSKERKQISFEDRATHKGHLHEWKAKRLLVKNCAKSGLCGGRAELLERLCYADFNLFQRVSLLLFEVMLC